MVFLYVKFKLDSKHKLHFKQKSMKTAPSEEEDPRIVNYNNNILYFVNMLHRFYNNFTNTDKVIEI